MSQPIPLVPWHTLGLSQVKQRWGWFVALGAILVILGTVSLGASTLMTLATMLLIGWLMIAGGVLQLLHAFSCRAWSGFLIDLLTGLLYVVVGFFIVTDPGDAAVSLTLIIAMFLIFSGIFRVALALAVRYQHWVWLLLNGLVNLLLGFSIWKQWPLSGLWVIGLFVGIDMIFNGWALVMLGMTAKNFPEEKPAA